MGLALMCADRLLTLFKKRAKAEERHHKETDCKDWPAHERIFTFSELDMGKPSSELVVYVPTMAVQTSRSCSRDSCPGRRITPVKYASPHGESDVCGSLPLMSADLPPHIPISRDGEEGFSRSQSQLSQLLHADYSGESVRPPPNRTVRPSIHDDSPPPYRTHSVNLYERCKSPPVYRCLSWNNYAESGRARTYSDSTPHSGSRRHSRNSSDSSTKSSRSDDLSSKRSSRSGAV